MTCGEERAQRGSPVWLGAVGKSCRETIPVLDCAGSKRRAFFTHDALESPLKSSLCSDSVPLPLTAASQLYLSYIPPRDSQCPDKEIKCRSIIGDLSRPHIWPDFEACLIIKHNYWRLLNT
ncbi:Transcriptional Adapter 2-Beta [Manis pentadactyla]|nr:Transcriptional Adapter 2-Beta [Manis pentadactyla]